jgi:hypothetical protein
MMPPANRNAKRIIRLASSPKMICQNPIAPHAELGGRPLSQFLD